MRSCHVRVGATELIGIWLLLRWLPTEDPADTDTLNDLIEPPWLAYIPALSSLAKLPRVGLRGFVSSPVSS